MLLGEITKLFIPVGSHAQFHLRDCNKGELFDLSARLGVQLIKPEDNTYADVYTMKLQKDGAEIFLHSEKRPMNDALKTEAFGKELQQLTGPEIANKELREALEVAIDNIQTLGLWLCETSKQVVK